MKMRKTFDHFGLMLKYLRESYGDRMHERNVFVPRGVKLSAAGLVDGLNDANYKIVASTYSYIEAGETQPRHGPEFIRAVCTCLSLDIGGAEWKALCRQLAYDVVRERLDQQFADLAVGEVFLDVEVPETPEVEE